MRLEQMQQQFADALLSDDRQITDCLISGRFAPDQLIQLYRNNFYISLSEILSDTFPVVLALVGDEFFAQMSKSYIRSQPPTTGSVTHFGQQFPNYINEVPQTDSLPYLADVARLEWAYAKLGNEWPTANTFPFKKLTTLSESQWAQIVFKLSANTVLLESNFAVLDIFNGIKNTDIDNIDINKTQQLLLIGSAKTGVSSVELTQEVYTFLSASAAHKALATIALPTDFEAILTSLISDGVIDNFELPETGEKI